MARAGTPYRASIKEIFSQVSLECSYLKEQQEKDEEEDGMLEYDSPSNDEESAYDETACDVGEISSLEGEANFLFGRVSRFGRSIRFKSRILFSYIFFLFFVFGICDRRHLLLLYAFVDIAIRFFNTDRSLPMLFSVIEVKQKEVVTVTSVLNSCKTSKTSKMTVSKDFNGSILIEKIITDRNDPFNDCKYMKIIYM